MRSSAPAARRRRPRCATAAAGLFLVPLSVTAAVITWTPATNTTSKADLIEGTAVIALSGGTLTPTVTGSGTGGTTTHAFIAANFSAAGLAPHTFTATAGGPTTRARTADNTYTPSAITSTGDTAFDDVIRSMTDANGTPAGITAGTLTLNGLTTGENYRIQVFFNDQRSTSDGRVMTYGDGNSHTVDVAGGNTAAGVQTDAYGQHAVGTFTADGTSQQLTLLANGFGNIHLNAVLVTLPPGANIPPVFPGTTLDVAENTPTGTVVGVLAATDTDGPDPLTYHITAGNDGAVFGVDPASGTLSLTGALNYATQPLYTLTVEADDGAATTPAVVTVRVIPSPGQAIITWSTAINTTGKTDLVEGDVVIALSGGTLATNVTDGGYHGATTYHFAPASYTSVCFFATGADTGKTCGFRCSDNAYDPSVLVTTGDPAFDTVICSFTDSQAGITTGTLMLQDLTPWRGYRVQVFFNDQRDRYDDRVMTYGDGNGNTVNLAGGDPAGGVQTNAYGQHAIGTFTAVADTQALTMTANGFINVHFNAIVVTAITDRGMLLIIR